MHWVHGSDIASSFSGIGKGKVLKLVKNSIVYQEALSNIGDTLLLSDETTKTIEQIVCTFYNPKRSDEFVNELRYWMFCKKDNARKIYHQHSIAWCTTLKGSTLMVWTRSLMSKQKLHSPLDLIWRNGNNELVPVLMSKNAAPNELIELTSCKYKNSACKRDEICQYKAKHLPCIPSHVSVWQMLLVRMCRC